MGCGRKPGGRLAHSSRNRPHAHAHAYVDTHTWCLLTPQLTENINSTIKENTSPCFSSFLSLLPLVVSLCFSLRPSTTAAPWNARPRRWATAGLGVDTETKEGRMTTTWSAWYPRRGELPDMDTGEKTGVIGHLRGLSVVTQRLTQVGKTTCTHNRRYRKLECNGLTGAQCRCYVITKQKHNLAFKIKIYVKIQLSVSERLRRVI